MAVLDGNPCQFEGAVVRGTWSEILLVPGVQAHKNDKATADRSDSDWGYRPKFKFKVTKIFWERNYLVKVSLQDLLCWEEGDKEKAHKGAKGRWRWCARVTVVLNFIRIRSDPFWGYSDRAQQQNNEEKKNAECQLKVNIP